VNPFAQLAMGLAIAVLTAYLVSHHRRIRSIETILRQFSAADLADARKGYQEGIQQ
jgi:hypothetical protein